jgi:hypothetical protein
LRSIARTGTRVYLDVTLWGTANSVTGQPLPAVGKDASLWSLDLAARRDGGSFARAVVSVCAGFD